MTISLLLSKVARPIHDAPASPFRILALPADTATPAAAGGNDDEEWEDVDGEDEEDDIDWS
jgi:hypothetical protein